MKEIELKYKLHDKNHGEMIFNIQKNRYNVLASTEEEIPMRAIYYDTEDHLLEKRKVSFRIRKEGEASYIATLKWQGSVEKDIHIRNEYNVKVHTYFPNLRVFDEQLINENILEGIKDKDLVPFITTDFTRNKVLIEINNSIVELAFDYGSIIGQNGISRICELEAELKTGDVKDLIELGNTLKNIDGLIPEDKSKFSRGLKL